MKNEDEIGRTEDKIWQPVHHREPLHGPTHNMDSSPSRLVPQVLCLSLGSLGFSPPVAPLNMMTGPGDQTDTLASTAVNTPGVSS